ncbi:MAG: hypothetical protein ACJ8AP_10175 [Gemmatimonadales bacterium]
MGFFGMLFWILVLWFAYRAWRRSERCVAVGPKGNWSGWYSRDRYAMRDLPSPPAPPEVRQDYIDSLESRISELEERLDFTERLLASRQERTA